MSQLVKRSFSVSGHRTSVALEPEFWEVLQLCATSRAIALARLVVEIDAARAPEWPLASCLRVFALSSEFRPSSGRALNLSASKPAL